MSTDLFVSTNRLLEKAETSLAYRYLHFALNCLVDGDGDHDDLAGLLYATIARHLKYRDDASLDYVSETVESISSSRLDFSRWHYLSLGLCAMGAFTPALLAFEKSKVLLLASRGRMEDASELGDLVKLVKSDAFQVQRHLINDIYRDRHVALIGAAPLSDLSARVAAQSDVVVQTKFHPTQTRRIEGASYRVSYLNGEMERAIVNNVTDLSAFAHAHKHSDLWLVTKSTPHWQLASMAAPAEGIPTPLLGPAMIGHRAMADILLAKPRRLSLHGFNLYASDKRHDSASWTQTYQRQRGMRQSVPWYCRSLGKHSVFWHQHFMAELHRLAFVDGDTEAREVSTVSGRALANRLQTHLGVQSWA